MAKKTDEPITLAGCLLSLGVLAFLALGFATSFALAAWVAVGIGVLAIAFAVSASRKRKELQAVATQRALAAALAAAEAQDKRDAKRLADLTERFGEEHAGRIVSGEYWQGATDEMMWESLGPPDDVKEKVYKTKRRETRCYRQTGANRFELRVHFENGIVVGWED